jgi:hypothetical protein
MKEFERFLANANSLPEGSPLDCDISRELMIDAFGKKSAVLDGNFQPKFVPNALMFIDWIGANRDASFRVNRLLLEQGDKICPHMHEDMYSSLLEAIESQIGFGKGIFTSTMMHMPERYSRMKLARWMRQDSPLLAINTHLRQATLSNAMSSKKFSLAHDMVTWMESLGENVFVQASLAPFDREHILLANLGGAFPESAHVDILCRSKAFMQALSTASSEESSSMVRKAMAAELGTTDSSWKGLLSHLCSRLLGDDYDSTTVLARYRSVGAVLLEHLQGMDMETRKAELIDDDLRVMGFKLGVQGVIEDMTSQTHKRQALVYDLSL